MAEKTKKHKILYLITKSNWGGAQKYVHDLATSISQSAEAIVVCGKGGELVDKLHQSGIRTIYIDSLGRDINLLSEIKVVKEFIDIFKRESPDIVHLNSSKVGGLGALAARVARVPKIIFTAHGWAFNENRGVISKKVIWLLSWVTVLLSHATIVLSTHEQKQAYAMPFARSKVFLIRNGIRTPAFKRRDIARQLLSEKISLPSTSDTLWLGTISELHSNKGLGYAIKAIRMVVEKRPDTRFVVIGEGEERKSLTRLITEEGLLNNVFLVGHVDDAASYLKAFDIFILASLKEGLPYAIIEAGLAQLPIIATYVGGIPEMIKDMESGILIKPGNSKEISDAILFLLEHCDNMKNFSKKACADMKHIFNHVSMVENTHKLYNIPPPTPPAPEPHVAAATPPPEIQ